LGLVDKFAVILPILAVFRVFYDEKCHLSTKNVLKSRKKTKTIPKHTKQLKCVSRLSTKRKSSLKIQYLTCNLKGKFKAQKEKSPKKQPPINPLNT
jgi:hypothetical protein